MSYFTSNEKPEQAYYGQQETPSSDYNASTVDYSQRYGNNDSANAQNTYGQQYESTNVGNTNYLNSQPQQQVTGQPQQLYGQQQCSSYDTGVIFRAAQEESRCHAENEG